MSIASLQSNHPTHPWAASGTSAATGSIIEFSEVQANFSTSASGRNAAGSGGASTSPANPLQSLASDIQAMLIQAQSTSPTGATGAAQAATPEQKVAADLQTLLGDIQAAVAPNTQTANSNPTAPTGATQPHHHHHHHEGGGEANGATDVAATSTAGAPAGGSQVAGGPSAAMTFATDIAQAIQAYVGASASAALPAMMV